LAAVTAVGTLGTVAGVTLLDGPVGALEPAALVAVTVNVYAVPFVRPVNTQFVELPDRAVEHEAGVATDGLEVTVNPLGAEPPLFDGAVQLTVAEALAPVTAPMVGALVTVDGVTLFEAAEAALVPAVRLVAVTLKV
jgi:hypothetical protein